MIRQTVAGLVAEHNSVHTLRRQHSVQATDSTIARVLAMDINMKHPIPFDPSRKDVAGEPTVIIGDQHNEQHTTLAPPSQITPEPMAPKPIPANAGHTRILGYTGSPAAEAIKADPVVAWLVVLDGPGKGNFRPVFRGSNTIGRGPNQRVPIDFGDDAISAEKQAFLVYDERKRQYQLVPNLERPNLVYLNDSALTGNADIKAHDKVTMGRTTLLFVPLCGPDFDWADTITDKMK